ncbi:MAG TPA: hypothetical protein VJS17_05120 [Pyrinomonadaceae bacterium]|nr:hypothetical protein [Pyrinomonadaceae bacterium]
MKRYLFLLSLIFTLFQTPETSVPIKDLRDAPETVVVGNKSLKLFAYAWRDFAPSSTSHGSPLMVAVKLTSADKEALPNVRMERVWVVFGEQVWEVSNLRGPGQDRDKDTWINCSKIPECQVTVRDGPQWGPEVFVDVIVRLKDSEGKEHLLRAPKQKVIGTV